MALRATCLRNGITARRKSKPLVFKRNPNKFSRAIQRAKTKIPQTYFVVPYKFSGFRLDRCNGTDSGALPRSNFLNTFVVLNMILSTEEKKIVQEIKFYNKQYHVLNNEILRIQRWAFQGGKTERYLTELRTACRKAIMKKSEFKNQLQQLHSKQQPISANNQFESVG